MESPILQGLNPAQRAAVEAYDSASLIIAGAGSGKTRVLTSRIAYMIEQKVDPKNILALTFTNKAAEQMRERIRQMVPGRKSRELFMGTFHSIFARILRTDAERIGFPANFTIYDASDARNLIKTIVKELNLADDKYKPNTIASRISQAKNALVTPGAYLANSAHATEDRRAQIPEFGNIYNLYCQRCKHNGAMDFDDLLLQTNILLRDCPDVLERYQEQFKYILVDEYQDTNYAQYIIVRRLSQHHGKVCVVGDDAQSIYSFRGAKIENILSFQRDYPEAKVFKLEQNYRSTRTIVEAANSVIVHNSRRMEKRCFSEGDEGEKIRVLKAYTDREEAELVVQDLRDKVRATGDAWNEAAILYRTNNQSQALEESLRRRGIPYRIYKGASFYDRKEIKDMLAYIRLVVNPRDDEAFRRIVNYPARGIGDTTVLRIAQLAAERGVSMWEAVDALVAEPVSDPVQRTIVRKVAEFVALIRSLSLERAQKGLYDFGMEVASRSGILALFRRENSPEATSALDNIEELLNSMQLFKEQRDAEIRGGEELGEATVEEWLQSVTLTTDMDKKEDAGDDDKVTLMTVHSAKGLEFKYVYIVGMEENLFPSQRAAESPEGFEEERRLFYVALTRAKCSAVLSYAEMRFKWGNMEFSRPSCFLREIDPRYLDGAVGAGQTLVREEAAAGGRTALEELRRRFDVRYQQRAGGSGKPSFGGAKSSFGGRGGAYSGGSRPESGAPSFGGRGGTDSAFRRPALQRPVVPENLRRLGGGAAPAAGNAAASGYAVGERVEHPKFGCGEIVRIETLAADHKLVVVFEEYGEKTLLAKFAKLTKR
ncbi:UvrD-helicase domain-containing protein [Alistipes communis]|uniref:ATP-dependent helicase n=1 Tax=Alistipes communis TaxID=2585118 RepID=UPI001D091D49|nr:UvrD-helicase domain-containing protein [Alistipes communis]MCB6996679.1 UvrD-helicase domain-containing protein [Alistipes communis]